MTKNRRKPRRQRRKGGKRKKKPKTTTVPRQLSGDFPVASTDASSTSNVDGQADDRRARGRWRSDARENEPVERTGGRGGGGGGSNANVAESRRNSGKKCVNRLVDHATCPHCNPTCPKMLNPFTGEIPGGGGGGGGLLTPNFGRYVLRQSEIWARAPERAPGRA